MIDTGIRGMSEIECAEISSFVERNFGIRMPASKKALLEGRLARRLRLRGIAAYGDYFALIKGGDAEETRHFVDLVSTHETRFFREPSHFEILKNTVLPGLGRAPAFWSAAASSGEEVWSIAATVEDYARQSGAPLDYSLLGTDVSPVVLERARLGIYKSESASQIPRGILHAHFLKGSGSMSGKIRVAPGMRSRARFQALNLLDENYGLGEEFDVVFCRNLLIYFERAVQEQVVRHILRYLKPGGFLFIGHAETLMGYRLPLVPVAPTVYAKK